MHALQAGASHQPLDPTVADLQVLAEHEFGVDAAMAVGAVGSGVRLPDGVHQVGLVPGPVAGRAAVPLVEAGGRDLQDPAGRRDGHPVARRALGPPGRSFWEDVLPREVGARAPEDLDFHLEDPLAAGAARRAPCARRCSGPRACLHRCRPAPSTAADRTRRRRGPWRSARSASHATVRAPRPGDGTQVTLLPAYGLLSDDHGRLKIGVRGSGATSGWRRSGSCRWQPSAPAGGGRATP